MWRESSSCGHFEKTQKFLCLKFLLVCVSAEISHASVKFGHLHGFYGDSCGVWLQLLGLQQGRLGTQLPPSHGHPKVLRLKTGIILSFSA